MIDRRLNARWLSALCLTAMVAVWVGPASALPAYRRLWVRQYSTSYSAMTCLICHAKGGGSELTPYGQDFQHYGATPAAFKAIERLDSDGDGALNLDEITAKSNPGDPQSTPANPGGWLQHVEESALPLEQLTKVFPGIKTFSALEGTLSGKQVQQAEASLGSRLTEDDAVPTFYFAVREQDGKLQRLGVALFVRPTESADKLTVAVGVDLSGKVTGVLLVKNKIDKRLADEKFLAQFIGKAAGDSMVVGGNIRAVPELDAPSRRVAGSVRKALLIISAAFAKKTGGE